MVVDMIMISIVHRVCCHRYRQQMMDPSTVITMIVIIRMSINSIMPINRFTISPFKVLLNDLNSRSSVYELKQICTTTLFSHSDSEPYYNYYEGTFDDSQSDQTITEYHENNESVGFHIPLDAIQSHISHTRHHTATTTSLSTSGEIRRKRYLGRISDERIFASNESRSDHSTDSI